MTAAKRGRFLFCFPLHGAIAFVYERRSADGETLRNADSASPAS